MSGIRVPVVHLSRSLQPSHSSPVSNDATVTVKNLDTIEADREMIIHEAINFSETREDRPRDILQVQVHQALRTCCWYLLVRALKLEE